MRKELKDVKERFKVKEKSLDEVRRKMENRLNMEVKVAIHDKMYGLLRNPESIVI